MLDNFFREGQPVYNPGSIDVPNEYTSDIEDCTELHCKMVMDEVLMCISPDMQTSNINEEDFINEDDSDENNND